MSKRKAYRPRPIISDPLTFLRPASAEDKARVMLRFHTAIENIRVGQHPGVDDWRDLSDAVNVVETLALGMHKLVPAEVMPDINAAIQGMVKASVRFRAGQGMRLDAPGLEALRNVLSMYSQCLDGFTAREMAMARAETELRVRAALRRKDLGHDAKVVAL